MNLQIFNNPQFGQVRTLEVNNLPYFVGRDVATALGYSNPVSAISQHVDIEDSVKHAIPDSQGFNQKTTLINESGVYSLVFGSKLPTAKAFKRWVTSEVLPAIRKSGGYIVAKEDESPEIIMARALQIANETIERSKQQLQIAQGTIDKQHETIKVLAPKAQYTDEVLQSTSTYTFTQCAKELNFRSATAFLSELKRRGIIFKQSGQYQLTSKFAGNGYTASRTTRYYHADGRPDTSTSTVITEKGRMWLHKLFGATNA